MLDVLVISIKACYVTKSFQVHANKENHSIIQ